MTPEERAQLVSKVIEILDDMGILSPLSGENCTHDETYFERVQCAEPCGSMHTYCSACGVALEPPCPFPERYPLGNPWVD